MTKREQTNALIARGRREEREANDAAYADTYGYNTQAFWMRRNRSTTSDAAQMSKKETLAATIAADKARLDGITDAFAKNITLESITKNEALLAEMED